MRCSLTSRSETQKYDLFTKQMQHTCNITLTILFALEIGSARRGLRQRYFWYQEGVWDEVR